MKILILANDDGGLWSFRRDLIIELIKNNQVYFSVPRGKYVDKIAKLGCYYSETQVDRRGINPIKDIGLFRDYRKILNRVKPDLVITYTIKPNIYGGMAARLAKIEYAINITGLGSAFEKVGIIRTIVINLYKYALKNAKVVFFENSYNRDKLVSFKCCSRNKTVVLKGAGVNTERYCYQPYPINNPIKFLFIGRVMKEKGVDELFAAMRRLISEKMNCFLDVVGPFEEDYRAKLEEYEKECWLKYHGFQEDVIPFIKNCDCFVLPSYHEGMANTNLECASSGRPIITSNIPGCKESVIEGETGYLCEPHSVDSLYTVMKKMIIIPESKREDMGAKGREYMVKNFEKKTVVESTLKELLS